MELYNVQNMPLSSDPERRAVQEKMLRGEPLTLKEQIFFGGGHDRPLKKIGDYECKPDHCYRAISRETFEIYRTKGYIEGFSDYLGDIIEPDGSTKHASGGVDWYLGGAAKRYGDIIIECPADKNYFQLNYNEGFGLSNDVSVRHMKSSGISNPVPFSMITNVFDLKKIKEQEKEKFDKLRQQEMEKMNLLRQQQLEKASAVQQLEQTIVGGESKCVKN